MRKLALLAALCVIPLSIYASQRQSGNHTAPIPQYVKDMKTMLIDTTAEEVDTSGASLPDADTSSNGSANNYCTSTLNSQGNAAVMSYGGSLDISNTQTANFTLAVTGQIHHPSSFGMFCYAQQPYNVPFANGFLCISPFPPGIQRMPTQALLNQPMIVLAVEDAQSQFAQITPGSSWYFQFWYRDPTAGGANFNTSDGLHVVFAGP